MHPSGGVEAPAEKQVPFDFAQGRLSTALASLASVGMTEFYSMDRIETEPS